MNNWFLSGIVFDKENIYGEIPGCNYVGFVLSNLYTKESDIVTCEHLISFAQKEGQATFECNCCDGPVLRIDVNADPYDECAYSINNMPHNLRDLLHYDVAYFCMKPLARDTNNNIIYDKDGRPCYVFFDNYDDIVGFFSDLDPSYNVYISMNLDV